MSRLLTDQEAQHFKEIIGSYRPNNEVLEKFKASNFAVIAGPAGAGKDTLRNSLIAEYSSLYVPVLSTTTRPQRRGEEDGKTYHFRTIEQVEEGFRRREFFQAALVHNQQISTLHISEIDKLNPSQYGLSILIVQTEKELREYHPKIKTIFIIPPDEKTLMERINSERKLDEAEIKRRLQAAKTEIAIALESSRYYCLISETVERITTAAHAYLQENIRNPEEDARARKVMNTIHQSI